MNPRFIRYSALIALILSTVSTSAGAQQNLPQGLTCGLSYLDTGNPPVENNSCNGHITFQCFPSPFGGCNWYYSAAPDYYVFFDGDIGIEAQHGYYHQELNNGMVYPADSSHFVLPQGAVCGFHHTGNSPGRTCMGFNPSRAFADITNDTSGYAGCPAGWTPRRALDTEAFYVPPYYWTWCEYQDPNHLTAGGATVSVSGLACGMEWNNSPPVVSSCQGYSMSAAATPAQFSRSYWLDVYAPSGHGLGFFTVTGNSVPAVRPPPPPPSCTPRSCGARYIWDSDLCRCVCARC